MALDLVLTKLAEVLAELANAEAEIARLDCDLRDCRNGSVLMRQEIERLRREIVPRSTVAPPLCNHILGDGSTLVVAADGCSLLCTVCKELVLELERVAVIVEPPLLGQPEFTCTHGSLHKKDGAYVCDLCGRVADSLRRMYEN